MGYFLMALLGFAGGAAAIYFLVEKRAKELGEVETRQHATAQAQLAAEGDLARRGQLLAQAQLAAEGDLARRGQLLAQQIHEFQTVKTEFDARIVSYAELSKESALLKQDLSTLYQLQRKGALERTQLDAKVQELGMRYLKDQERWIGKALNANNFADCRLRMVDAVAACRAIGLLVPEAEERRLLADLASDFDKAVRAAAEREEQARIKAQIREEQKLEKEAARAIEQAARERALVEMALEKALQAAKGEHSAEIEALRAKLAEAEAKSQRAVSQAQLTKSGFVYVISNLGSFGEGVYKIGMTRRLEPLDRVEELGDASVPFPFDVHMMISTTNAPALENALHRAFCTRRMNKVNLRKEFFRVALDEVVAVVRANHGEVEYQADAEALQYRQSQLTSDAELRALDRVYAEYEASQPLAAAEVE